MSKQTLKFVLSDATGRYSADWRVIYNSNAGDVYVQAKEIGKIIKLTLHAPRPVEGKNDWIMHVRRAANPFKPNRILNKTIIRSVASQPLQGLICVCAICIPLTKTRPQLPNDNQRQVLLPPTPGMQATITIWVCTPSGVVSGWPGKSKSTSLIWSAQSTLGSILYVVRKDEPSVSIKLPKAMLTWPLAYALFRNPHSSILAPSSDKDGVGVLWDFNASVLFLSLPAVLSESAPPKLRTPLKAVIWAVLLLTRRVKLNWQHIRRLIFQ